ncbi:MAG TPA: hypothetical protein QGG59_09670 [Planctomycetota bacterium]|jgi:hypothetical protein|nr:hypothetical protein [Planctomycetota bacterium]MDP7558943.1 hypothetical protein [Planctomycetota bacterium]HJM40372.1 hypothetical protein [Planctomycetota bacterium]
MILLPLLLLALCPLAPQSGNPSVSDLAVPSRGNANIDGNHSPKEIALDPDALLPIRTR